MDNINANLKGAKNGAATSVAIMFDPAGNTSNNGVETKVYSSLAK